MFKSRCVSSVLARIIVCSSAVNDFTSKQIHSLLAPWMQLAAATAQHSGQKTVNPWSAQHCHCIRASGLDLGDLGQVGTASGSRASSRKKSFVRGYVAFYGLQMGLFLHNRKGVKDPGVPDEGGAYRFHDPRQLE